MRPTGCCRWRATAGRADRSSSRREGSASRPSGGYRAVTTGRSHLAAVVANGCGEGLIRARSGGVTPGESIRPEIQDLLRRRGFDPEQLSVTAMTSKLVLTSDVVA